MNTEILDGTIDDAKVAINELQTVEEINAFREYEEANKDREGIYDLLEERQQDLEEDTEDTSTVETTEEDVEISTEVQVTEPIVVENGTTGLPETIEASNDDEMREKLLKLKPSQLEKMNPDILRKYNI